VPAAEEANLIQQHHLQPLGHKKKSFHRFQKPVGCSQLEEKTLEKHDAMPEAISFC